MFKSKSNRVASKPAEEQPAPRQDYFASCHRTYSCIHCRAQLANHDELISKLFQGNHGRAYLFNKVVNVGCKPAVRRELLTGLHAVADIYCDSCETTLGWKYEQAFVASQKYKEGKYIIELVHMLKENDWDLSSYNARRLLKESELGPSQGRPVAGEGPLLERGCISHYMDGRSKNHSYSSKDQRSAADQSGRLKDAQNATTVEIVGPPNVPIKLSESSNSNPNEQQQSPREDAERPDGNDPEPRSRVVDLRPLDQPHLSLVLEPVSQRI